MLIQRRTFFKGAAAAAVITAGGATLSACGAATPRGWEGQSRPLPIPPLDEGTMVDGVRTFDLHAGAHDAQILPDTTTRAWGFNGGHLGPTLYFKKGDRVQVNVHNGLDEMTTIHWHGMKIPAEHDGGPHQPIEPGEVWEPQWTIEQPAATLWYHPHPHERTALHAYRGLAGGIVIDDGTAEKAGLPRDYGVDDIPVIIMDQKFNEDGSLNEESDPDIGLKGDVPTVNGITNPYFNATTTRVRLRILDASTMRFFNLAFADGRQFHVVATDSGFLPAPVTVDHVKMGPGERQEIIVDLEPGKDAVLRAIPHPDRLGVPDTEHAPDFGLDDDFDLLTIVAPQEGAAPAALPTTLIDEPPLPTDIAEVRDFALNTFQINGEYMDMNRVDVTIDHARPELWRVTNENADWIHNFHIHDARFQVTDVRGTDVDFWTQGWKDTVTIPPGATVDLLVEFGYYPDPKWAYMYHCHMLLHEDEGMMGQFVVVKPGESADLAAIASHGGHHEH
ncbi:multicopper oxidase family protein [Corynebacterium renale]|uniref:multicopper oxidase family protein n=1 Tax=Corynebacterium renale TaxID=1724 RepID=UPI000E035BD9|nr:multicopper oxidase domain-containing protein [Corynebacterium renale]STC95038.1 putative multicopper oxidase [Corynebacterium renale]